MPATSHLKPARPAPRGLPSRQPGSAAIRRPRARRRVAAAAPGAPGLFAGSARTAAPPFRSACPPLSSSRSFPSPARPLGCVLLSWDVPFSSVCFCSHSSFFLSSVYPLRSISAGFFPCSLLLCSLPSGPLASASTFRCHPAPRCFVQFPFPSFGLFTRCGFLSAPFVADPRAVAASSLRSSCSGAAGRALGPAVRAGSGAPSGDPGPRVRPARRRAPRSAGYLCPAVLRAQRDRRLWLGSEEPGQLLLIKSQLWFLSGEPLSKGTGTELRGLAHFLR